MWGPPLNLKRTDDGVVPTAPGRSRYRVVSVGNVHTVPRLSLWARPPEVAAGRAANLAALPGSFWRHTGSRAT